MWTLVSCAVNKNDFSVKGERFMRNRNALRILIGVFCLLSLCVGMKEAAAADYQELRTANGGRIAQAQRFITTVLYLPLAVFPNRNHWMTY